MIPVLEDAVLGSDLDCQNFDLRNIDELMPVPDGLVSINDPGLTDGRTPPDGSVTNETVNATAAIDQSKLSLNGVIPTAWLGSEGLAAPGDLVERIENKGAPNGYAAMDAEGKIDASHFTPGDAIGSITSIGLTFESPLKNFGPQQITSSGTFDVRWKSNTPGLCWLGNDGHVDPQYPDIYKPFYIAGGVNPWMVTNLPCSKFTSGVFRRINSDNTVLLPIAQPMGQFHARGMVPDTGASGGHNMYLGRDIQWHYFTVNDPNLAHQPKVPDVTIVLDWWEEHKPTLRDPSLVKAHVTIRSLLKGSYLFYRVTPVGTIHPPAFQNAIHDKTPDDVHITLEVNERDIVDAYAARTGYNDSDIEHWQVITPITDLRL